MSSTSYADRLLSIIDQGIAALEPWAEWTPIKTDDGLLSVLKGIKHDAALLGYAAKKAADADAGVLNFEAGPSQELRASLDAAGMTWEVFVAVLAILLKKAAMGS